MSGRLSGKVALVTGAGRGIGAAIATAFAAEGASVFVAELDPQTGAETAAALAARGGRAAHGVCDVSDKSSVEAAVLAAKRTFGPVDVLVNNAGVNVFRDPLTMSEADWRMCLAIDVEGALHATRAVLPDMLARNSGSIINIASVHGFSIIPGCFPYPVAKHALLGLTRALGIEYAARGIRVNAIAPGYIDTQICRDYWATFPDPAAERRRAEKLHPPGRLGRPEEVAMTAVFLASDEAPFINASVITIDGGRSTLYHD
ncbi:MAG: SDR family oxidoreductase [Gammaproteobacteria bacterium]|nr:SDR family oxidoreductase [Gammaproteobacteria bacterium]